ncbi:MAG: thiamine-monophosphate kinase [Pirellulales bacterium]|nr:thiamine-monophosphate kinase [Pirellulales bacterium]
MAPALHSFLRGLAVEFELIAELRRRIGPHPQIRLGPGDDAAVLAMADVDECVVTVDVLTDGVDFKLDEIDARRAGRKALAVNLSDLAAMAARPLAGVVGLVLPRRGGLDLALALYDGLLPLAEKYDLAIAGGDTNSWDAPLVISVTLLGQVTPRGPLRRDGARPGDRLLVTGAFGGSLLGRHLDFEPRVHEALLLNERYALDAGIDASDGLSLDLARVCQESRCGAVLDLDALPVADDAHRLARRLDDGSTAVDHALGDGEDFELILAVAPETARRIIADQPLEIPMTDIGQFVAESGLWQTDRRHGHRPLTPRGWEHGL